MRNIRLALLVTNQMVLQSPTTRAIHGDYPEIWRRYLASSLALITFESEITFTIDAYDVMEDMTYPPDSTHYDGIIIGGSNTSVNDDIPWVKKLIEYVKHIVEKKPTTKLFGICFGHQIICKALGSRVERKDWEVSVTTINLTHLGKALFHADTLNLQLYHHDQVVETPPRGYLLGLTNNTHVQGIVILNTTASLPADLDSDAGDVSSTTIQVLTLQGHPELTESIIRKHIHKNADILGPELVKDALSRVWLPTHAIDKVGGVIWGVLGVGKSGF